MTNLFSRVQDMYYIWPLQTFDKPKISFHYARSSLLAEPNIFIDVLWCYVYGFGAVCKYRSLQGF